MAGSFDHCDKDDGTFCFDLIENMGDAHEACEEMHWLVRRLANGDDRVIEKALEHFYAMSRGEAPEEPPLKRQVDQTPKVVPGKDGDRDQVDTVCGFTPDEKRCHDALMEMLEAWHELPFQHLNEGGDIIFAVHLIQGTLATRIARRAFPEGWPTHPRNPGGSR